jgi:hypothetical protein
MLSCLTMANLFLLFPFAVGFAKVIPLLLSFSTWQSNLCSRRFASAFGGWSFHGEDLLLAVLPTI